MSLQLYNTLSRTLETFKPLKQDEVKVYYCGPTPYNFAHIGNLRNYLMDDFIVRSMRYLGYKVKTTMNITDIDDKTIRDSQRSGKSLKAFTEYYTTEFFHDCARLGIIPADNIKPISELISDMGEIIDGLIQKGYAYIAEDGSIYYSVKKFKKYGNLAHLDFKGMISSVRIDNDEYDKEQVADFALWKAYDPEVDGENKWEIIVNIPEDIVIPEHAAIETLDSSGILNGQKKLKISGRPGWHIECSACNKHFFGDQIDIHMGGVDLVFPHHQNEIAQTEAFTGKEFAKYWLHGGHLLVDNKKMTKSAQNFYTLRDILEKVTGSVIASETELSAAIQHSENQSTGLLRASQGPTQQEILVCRGFRLMGLQNSYRENFNFTYERLESAMNTISGLDEMMKRLGRYIAAQPVGNSERNAHGKMKFHDISREFRENQQYFMQEFIEKLENDFDTVNTMTIVFEFQGYINSGIDDELFSLEEAKSLVDLLRSWDTVLGILDFSLLENTTIIPENITKLALDRVDAKVAKNWGEADRIRDELLALGWKMIDEKDGKWRVEKV